MSRTIDITPTWRGILPLLLAGYTEGNESGRAAAIEELYRMADAADFWNAHCREAGIPDEEDKA
jgi:hypothetical protein